MKCKAFTVAILVSALCQEMIQGSDIFLRHVEKRGRPPRSCSYLPAPGCTCRSRYGRISISCVELGLTEFPTMDGIPPGKLLDLDLSGNRFSTFPIDVFDRVTLSRLIIRNNDPPDNNFDTTFEILRGQNELTYVDMSNSSLTLFVPSAFSRLSKLKVVKIPDNRIVIVQEHLVGYPALERLQLDGNPLVAIKPHAFTTMRDTLKHLTFTAARNLNSDKLDDLNVFVPCQDLKNLESLGIRDTKVGNALSSITATECLPKLKSLTCDNCGLNDLLASFVTTENGDKFEELRLPNNELGDSALITLLNDGAGGPKMPTLKILDLSHNDIETIIFVNHNLLPSLVRLDLSNNRLASFPPELFLSPDLAYVDLSYNSLSGLDTPYMMDWENRHLTVRLQGNPLMCTCDLDLLVLMQRQLAGESGPLIPYEIETLTCSGPDNLMGIKVATVASEVECSEV